MKTSALLNTWLVSASASSLAIQRGGEIKYAGGLVVSDQLQVQVIFYGDEWFNNSKPEKIMHFVNGLNASGYLKHLEAYRDHRGKSATSDITVNKPFVVPKYPFGKELKDETSNSVLSIVKKTLDLEFANHKHNMFYMVFLDKTVTNCFRTGCSPSQGCGSHSSAIYQNMPLGYAWAVDGDGETCDIPSYHKKNGLDDLKPPNAPGIDGLVHAYANLLVKYITNPGLPCPKCKSKFAFFDEMLLESADKCAFVAGKTNKNKDGKDYNIVVQAREFLIQQYWDLEAQECRMFE